MWTIDGKTCIVTGASSGIGRETALGLAKRGAHVVLVCRSEERGAQAKAAVERAGSSRADLHIADLSSQSDVRRLASELLQKHPRIDVLLHNAGVVVPQRRTSVDGRELTLSVNHLAPFLLTHLLLERLSASKPARIVVVASQVEANGRIHLDDLDLTHGYQPLEAYCQSKLANVLFTYELARRLDASEVTVNCLHPGVIATNLLCDYMGRPRAMNRLHRLTHPGPRRGAETSLRLVTDDHLSGVSGRYFRPEGEASTSRQSYDEQLAAKLWDASARLTGVSSQGPTV